MNDKNNVKSFVFMDEDPTTLEEQVNVYIQSNKLLELHDIKISYTNSGKYMIVGTYDPTHKRRDKSDVFVRFFQYSNPEDALGFMHRFMNDKKITGSYYHDVSVVEGEDDEGEPTYIACLTHLKNDNA